MSNNIPYICIRQAKTYILRKYEEEMLVEARRLHEEMKAKDRGEQKTMTEMLKDNGC